MPDHSLLRSKRFWVALIILAGIVLLRYSPYLITPGILLLAGLTYPQTLRPLMNYKFWITIGLLVLIVPVFTGSQDRAFWVITYSSARLKQTTLMSLRGISIFLLFQVLTTQLKSERISSLFSKLGIKHFDAVYTQAQEVTPSVKSIIMARYAAFREAWRKKRAFAAVFNLAGEVLADFIILANQLSDRSANRASPRPRDLLEGGMIKQQPALVIVVGDVGAGKTPWLKELVKALTSSGKGVDGLIAEKVADGKHRWRYVLKRIATGESRPFSTMDQIETPFKAGRFYFYPQSVAWGREQLIATGSPEWLIVDEIGLLEMEGGGLIPALQTVVTGFSGCMAFSMRIMLAKQLETFLSQQLPAIQNLPRHMIYL